MGAIIIALIFAVGAGYVAQQTGGSFWLWFVVGAIFPLLGVVLAYFCAGGKICPSCRSRVHKEASRCPKCTALLPVKS